MTSATEQKVIRITTWTGLLAMQKLVVRINCRLFYYSLVERHNRFGDSNVRKMSGGRLKIKHQYHILMYVIK